MKRLICLLLSLLLLSGCTWDKNGHLLDNNGMPISGAPAPIPITGTLTTNITVNTANFSLPIAESDVTNLVADLAAKEDKANKGAINGYASLNGTGKLPLAQIDLPPGGGSVNSVSGVGSVHSSGGADPVISVDNITTTNITNALPSQSGKNGYRLTTNGTDMSWQPPSFAGSYTYYFQNTASDVVGEKKMLVTTYSPKTTLTSLAVTQNETIQTFITDPGIPNLMNIPAGAYEIHIHASATGGTKTVQIHGEIWETTSNGTLIAEIGEAEPTSSLTGSELEYRMVFVSNNTYTINSTSSRVMTRFHTLLFGGGSSPDVNFYVGGTADAHLSFPSATLDVSNFVPYNGAVNNLNMGSYNVTATSYNGTWQGTAISDPYISSSANWSAKQEALVSGTNIKTINGSSLLGSGDLVVSGGSSNTSYLIQSSIVSNNLSATGVQVPNISFNFTSNEIYLIHFNATANTSTSTVGIGFSYIASGGNAGTGTNVYNLRWNHHGTAASNSDTSGSSTANNTVQLSSSGFFGASTMYPIQGEGYFQSGVGSTGTLNLYFYAGTNNWWTSVNNMIFSYTRIQ